MNFAEMICSAKVYSVALGMAPIESVSDFEVEIVIEGLKKMAEDRNDWNQEQKEIYKLMADSAKQTIKTQGQGF